MDENLESEATFVSRSNHLNSKVYDCDNEDIFEVESQWNMSQSNLYLEKQHSVAYF